ncbi:hypothetical protein [Streptomyces griseosporeus]|uniref:hypothetical protein n=1 Tax=Streptomyces griseosporeus TaxID=1910 RepID=UPI0036FC7AD5
MAFLYIRTRGTEVDAFLGQLARHLRPQVKKLSVLLLRRVNGELPELWENADIEALTLEETAQHVTALLDLLETRPGVSASKAPPAALDLGAVYPPSIRAVVHSAIRMRKRRPCSSRILPGCVATVWIEGPP